MRQGVGWGPRSGMCSRSQRDVLRNGPFPCISQHLHGLLAPSPETSGRSCFPPGTRKTIIISHFWRKISIKFLGGRRQGRPHINPCASSSHCPLPERPHRQKPSWCYLTWSLTTSSVASAWRPCSSGRSCASTVTCQPVGCSCWMGYAGTYFKHLGPQCLK